MIPKLIIELLRTKEIELVGFLWESSMAFITDRIICSFPPFSERAYSFSF